MSNINYNILYKVHEYKKQLNTLEQARYILKELNESTYFQPYKKIEKELDKIIYNFYKEYEKLNKELEKIKNTLTVDDIISLEY